MQGQIPAGAPVALPGSLTRCFYACRCCVAGDAATGAILTPYKGQVRSLEYGLRVLAPWFEGLSVSVSSVDAYQGREADVIVFSAVRWVSRCFHHKGSSAAAWRLF
jgi:hypothetical protein